MSIDVSDVVELVRVILKHDDVDETSAMDSTKEWDSLRQLFIIMAIEESFGVKIDDDSIEKVTSINSIFHYLKNCQ